MRFEVSVRNVEVRGRVRSLDVRGLEVGSLWV